MSGGARALLQARHTDQGEPLVRKTNERGGGGSKIKWHMFCSWGAKGVKRVQRGRGAAHGLIPKQPTREALFGEG